ncbi:DUF2141 domain-containing protein [Alteraurantiacibacter palmitatis]|uniref:DUF2141 domain-containing protein n=1 Tax=Alteraurantiacibacter palmitatis TaxID=2054628 RepID=A0ABV7E6C7_9SPHN
MRLSFSRLLSALAAPAALLALALPGSAAQAQYHQEIRNDMAVCRGAGPAVRVNVSGIKNAQGTVRAQIYRATQADWLQSGRWMYRIELPAQAGNMSFCMPVPANGSYAVAVRHDVNGNGSTDLRTDGGAMSNNPSINIFNLGRPSVSRTAFDVTGVTTINITMRYM